MKPRCVVIAARWELPPEARVWGTGGWLPPGDREALDWLTLIRLLGWDVTVAYAEDRPPALDAAHCVIVAAESHLLARGWPEALAGGADAGTTVVVRSTGGGDLLEGLVSPSSEPVIEGDRLSWIGPGKPQEWCSGVKLTAPPIASEPDATVWAQLDERPVVVARRQGSGTIMTLAFSPSSWRDASGVGTAFLRHLLVNCRQPEERFVDLSGLLILRMDDPGSSQSAWCRGWTYPKLRADQWAEIAPDLARRNACLSIGYVPAWVDDGDATRGELEVDGRRVARRGGRIHDSWRVRYRDLNGYSPGVIHDLVSEYEGIRALTDQKLASVELHGFTHMTPDLEAWSAAPDRYESMSWYRELASPALAETPFGEHPLARAVERLQEAFDTRPTSLIPPGDEWTNHSLEVALDLGVQLVDSYYLALRVNDRFCWTTHVCAPYLDLPDEKWFEAGLPVVGYFHDYEPAVYGVGWMTSLLDRWEAAGATRMTDLRTLTQLLGF